MTRQKKPSLAFAYPNGVRTKIQLITLAAGCLIWSQPDLLETLFSFDKDKDGKLSKAEVPERMQGIFARADADKDGFLSREELTKATAGGQGERRGPGGPPMDPLLRAMDTNQDGALSAAEIAGAGAALKTLDKNGDGMLSGEELRPAMGMGMRGGRGPGGGGAPDMNRMFDELDTNKDGVLSREEMGRMGGRRRE
jgi:Ca2+-binding EF-hand superfamily protein